MAKFSKSTTREDIYATVTNRIIEQLEAGVRPWSRSWKSGVGPNAFGVLPTRVTGEHYQGINILLLWGTMEQRGYRNPIFMTFKQAQELGGFVRKGEKGSTVVYASAITREVEGDNGQTEEERIPFMKQYAVFNCEQIEGLPERFYQVTTEAREPTEVQAFFARAGVAIRHGGDKAFYTPAADFVQMPAPEAFESLDAYHATLAHEAVHSTGHPSRLDRKFGKRFGDHAYAAEELVAELGAAFLCGSLGISSEPREDHASYLASWLKVLKQDKRAVFTAARMAQQAADFVHNAAEAVQMAQAA